MKWIFRGFCINHFGLGPLHRSDFGFEFAEIYVFEKQKTTPRIGEIAYGHNYFQTFK